MKINKEFITKNRYNQIHAMNIINNFFKRFGLDLKFDISYHGSYLFGTENLENRQNFKIGKVDAKFLMQYFSKDSIVLDIGCGCGRVEKFLECKEIHGIDISSKAISIAKKNVPNAFFYSSDNLDIFPDKKFDFVFEIATFHHMPREDFLRYIKDIFRVLKDGGIFFFTFNDLKNNFNYRWFEYHADLNDQTSVRMRFYTEEEIRFLLKKNGFKNIKISLWKNRWNNNVVKYVVCKKVYGRKSSD